MFAIFGMSHKSEHDYPKRHGCHVLELGLGQDQGRSPHQGKGQVDRAGHGLISTVRQSVEGVLSLILVMIVSGIPY